MMHILQFAFSGIFVSFDGVYEMAQNTFCIAYLVIKNCSLDSNIFIQLCVSGKYDLPRKKKHKLCQYYIPRLKYIFELQILEYFVLPLYSVILSKH